MGGLKLTLKEQEWLNWEAHILKVNNVILTHFSKEEIQSICPSFPEYSHENIVGQTAEFFCLSWIIYLYRK